VRVAGTRGSGAPYRARRRRVTREGRHEPAGIFLTAARTRNFFIRRKDNLFKLHSALVAPEFIDRHTRLHSSRECPPNIIRRSGNASRNRRQESAVRIQEMEISDLISTFDPSLRPHLELCFDLLTSDSWLLTSVISSFPAETASKAASR